MRKDLKNILITLNLMLLKKKTKENFSYFNAIGKYPHTRHIQKFFKLQDGNLEYLIKIKFFLSCVNILKYKYLNLSIKIFLQLCVSQHLLTIHTLLNTLFSHKLQPFTYDYKESTNIKNAIKNSKNEYLKLYHLTSYTSFFDKINKYRGN